MKFQFKFNFAMESKSKQEKSGNPTEVSVTLIEPIKISNVGNIDELYKKDVTNDKTEFIDTFKFPAGTSVTDTGNIKRNFEEQSKDNTTIFERDFDFTKNN